MDETPYVDRWLTFTLTDGRWDIQLWSDSAKPVSGKVYRFKVQVPPELVREVAANRENSDVFRFPAEILDDVAAILKPKRLLGSATLTVKQRQNLERRAFRGGKRFRKINAEAWIRRNGH